MLKKLVISLWFLVFCFLFLYSFVQVDLGLTLTRASFFQTFQRSFQYVGYFNRPLSTYLYCSIIVLLFALYVLTLWLVKAKRIEARTVWIITIIGSAILLFSYNAFSYDLFNYIFDAKIVTHYLENPYQHKALDYPGDPMLGFMHWVHRTYPYGPLWLGLTIPLSFMGFSYFLFTFYLFKTLMVGSYLLCGLVIEKISRKTKIIDPVFALTFFALNPLVIIESLVSAHHDLVMILPALFGVYMLHKHKKYTAWLLLLSSALIKFATLLLVPLYILYPFIKHKNKDYIFFLLSILLMVIAVYLASSRTTFQPWYLLFVLPFASFLSNKYYVLIPSAILSFLVLFQYVPYLYTGNYNPPIPMIMNQMLWGSIGVGVVIMVLYGIYRQVQK